jgi:predicted TIM-barrel fold metal-dependent hydrolase
VLHADTTMAFVDFFPGSRELARALAPRLAPLADRIVLGTDFPNLPYDYAHQLEVLLRLDLGEDWLRRVLWHNGARLLGLAAGEAGRGWEQARRA